MTYPAVTDFKSWAGIAGTADDAVAGVALNAAIKWFERFCNKLFVPAASIKYFPAIYPYVLERGLLLNLRKLWLQSVTTLTNGDGVAIFAASYVLLPVDVPYYQIRLKPTAGIYFWGGGTDGQIALNGSWGYSAACPADVFLGILALTQADYLARLQGVAGPVAMVSKSGIVLQPSEMPKRVLEIAAEYKRRGL